MTVRIVRAVVVAFAVMLPMAGHAASVEKFHNEKVAVTEVTLGPGEQNPIVSGRSTAIVYLSDGAMLYGRAGTRREVRPVHQGEVVAFPARMSSVQNVGKAPLRFVRIEFLTNGEDETWGMTGLPESYKMVSEDRHARTYEIRLPPGAVEGQHTHHARVVVCLSGTEMEHTLPDGTKQLVTLKTGDILWREAATHAGRNLGKTELWEIAVEPK